jgi:beta-xylosidase
MSDESDDWTAEGLRRSSDELRNAAPTDQRVLSATGQHLVVLDETDAGFLNWIKERLINVYHEKPMVDFVLRLEKIVEKCKVVKPDGK